MPFVLISPREMIDSMEKRKGILLASALLLCLFCWTLWANTALEVNEYEIRSSRIPERFSGFRIAQISDLHNAEFGEDNGKLLALLAETDPDIIVLTGDLIDSRRTDIDIALDFARRAIEIAPVYYVSGNHEARVSDYQDLSSGLTEAGVMVLENQNVRYARGGEVINIMGISDPSFRDSYLFGEIETVAQAISQLKDEVEGYTVLLSHRPELFEVYADLGMDLVFSGHAHGGQFRLPFLGGLVAPNQGFFPKYDAGLFEKNATSMIVSRGIGNSIIPLRFNNRPEIVLVTLRGGET